jgi:hypothetical protein
LRECDQQEEEVEEVAELVEEHQRNESQKRVLLILHDVRHALLWFANLHDSRLEFGFTSSALCNKVLGTSKEPSILYPH